MVCTNGALMDRGKHAGLTDDGLSSVIMSIDAHEVAQARKEPRLARRFANRSGSPTNFSREGHPDHGEHHGQPVDRRLRQTAGVPGALGFKSCTFSYPLTSLASSYLSFSDSGLVNYKKDELLEVFEKIKQMKTPERVRGGEPD